MARFRLLTELAGKLVPEYRFNWPYLDWWEDKPFNAFLDKFDEGDGWNTEKRLMMYQLLRLVEGIPGDTVECGAWRGAGSYMICLMNERSSQHTRWHHVFDSFEGLSEPGDSDGEHWKQGDMSVSFERVQQSLEEFERFSLYKGWIPEKFPELDGKEIAFLHIDVDLYQPTLDTMEFFYPRLNQGGVIVCDDYGSGICPGATKAIDEYLQDKPEKMLFLPGGSGFLIKGCQTAAQIR